MSRGIALKDTGGVSDGGVLKQRALIYLGFVFGFSCVLSIVLSDSAGKEGHGALVMLFSFFPFLSSLLARVITSDRSPWMLKPNLRKNWRVYFLAGFLPGFLIFLGAFLYFWMFPDQLDTSAKRLIETYGQFGVPSNLPHTVGSIIRIGIVGVLVSPFALPVAIFALGEEVGWRGYFLPILLRLMDKQKAILLSGLLWGLCHAPLIYLGFNYGLSYSGAPYTGILMMTLVGVVLNVWLSYVTIKTDSVIPASILHGAVNVIGEFPALVAFTGTNTLLGPNPTGIIGMSFLMVGSIVLLRMLSQQNAP